MWARYDGEVVRQELAGHGCTLTCPFCYCPDFMAKPEALDEEVMARSIAVLDLHNGASGASSLPAHK